METNQSYYGIFSQTKAATEFEAAEEELLRNGFFVKPDFLDPHDCEEFLTWSEEENTKREILYGSDLLKNTQDFNIVRVPLAKNRSFFDLIVLNQWLDNLLERLFAKTQSYYCLNQQNIILNKPESLHKQTSWHRDMPYQPGINSIPCAYSVLVTLTDFNTDNGGTILVPGTHNHSEVPSWHYIQNNQKQISCPAGSAIIFDSLLIHRAGVNKSNQQRVAVNNVFTLPTFQQQISFPTAMLEAGVKWTDDLTLQERQRLGFGSETFRSEKDYLHSRNEKDGLFS